MEALQAGALDGGTRNMATLLGVSFVIHQMGSVIGAWGGGMIFDMFGNYDLAWRFGVSLGIVAGRNVGE